eukprot:CAMPEP_0178586350 /NCGR_PEP_ID=MMETSP0697-20121206/25873_1 /TAXON_ID=265572 /ORGANISM="Extubocellulus spinifer, Strain CCMP396" /LENGTH=57 /DNA_ID=CAMNT_0020222467 /DNA_START=448 /DNA_END=621 /DNA_ORIENTATION=-
MDARNVSKGDPTWNDATSLVNNEQIRLGTKLVYSAALIVGSSSPPNSSSRSITLSLV